MYRRLSVLFVLLVLAAGVVGIGFVRGWFVVDRNTPEPGSNKVNYNLTVDPDKVKADAAALEKKAAELTGKSTEGSK
jgi:hypothetical protein